MSAKLIFFIVATAVTIGSAALAGLTVAVIGLSIKMPAASLIPLTVGAATAIFATAVTLASMAASLFFNSPGPPTANHPPTSTAKQPQAAQGSSGSGATA